tara:strand:+ start:1010 stop:1207 length:198 start_codon:yes stop_codon:yes gene_type:complete
MKEDYDKKDIKESPKTKDMKVEKKSELPEGWGMFVKRGKHVLFDPNGKQTKHASKEAAMEFANGQ